MWKRARIIDSSATGQALIRKKSKIPGVMITQFVSEIPEDKSTPDFTRKPISLTIQEDKLAVFKAIVTGDPTPKVTWTRAKGKLANMEKFQSKYDQSSNEHTLEIHKVCSWDADTYKCFAENQYGRAVCTAKLNVIEVGFKKEKAMEELDIVTTDPSQFRKLLRKSKEDGKQVEKRRDDGEIDERFWEIIMNADRKDYERICAEYGVTDFRLILKKLEQRKVEREEEQSKYVEYLKNLRHIEVKGEGLASFELELELKDPSSRIFLYKEGVMIAYDDGGTLKHSLKAVGKKLVFSIKDLMPEDAGLYQVDVEEVNLFSTEFKIPRVDFIVKIQEVKAQEREDAIFECVLSHPLPKIKWIGKNSPLENGDKYSITVSEDKLIHRLLIKDCKQLDKGIYAAVAGIKSCSAWLVVEADNNAVQLGKKKLRKTTSAGGAGIDLGKVAQDQRAKIQEEVEKMDVAMKTKKKSQEVIIEKGFEEISTADSGNDTACYNINATVDGEPKMVTASEVSEKDQGDKKDKKVYFVKEDMKQLNTKQTKTDQVHGNQTPPIKPSQSTDGDAAFPNTHAVEGVCTGIAQKYTDSAAAKKKTTKPDNQDFTESKCQSQDSKQTGQSSDAHHQDESADECTSSNGTSRANQGSQLQDKVIAQAGMLSYNGHTTDSNEGKYSLVDEDFGGSDNHSRCLEKGQQLQNYVTDPNKQTDKQTDEQSGSDGNGNTTVLGGPLQKHAGSSQRIQDNVLGDSAAEPNTQSHYETGDSSDSAMHSRRKRQGHVLQDTMIDPGVQFVSGLTDVNVLLGESAAIKCKLNSEDCDGAWFRDGKKLSADENVKIIKEGSTHKLMITSCKEEHSGKYRFEADGRKTEAIINVKDPPRFDPGDLCTFTKPVIVKVGQNAVFKIPFVGYDPIKIQWFKEGEELITDTNIKIERTAGQGCLLLSKCQRKDTGEVKIKLRNEHGTTEAISQLIVLDKPTPPLGPTEVTESSATCIAFKWRPPKDDGGSPVTNYVVERQQVGRNTWKKLGEIPGVARYRDTEVDHGHRYCYRIQAVTAQGTSEMMETDDIQAGTLDFPGPPTPPKVINASKDYISLSWDAPVNTGGSRILGYTLEKRKKGSNIWSAISELIKERNYTVKDVVEGIEYEFRVLAMNISGVGEYSNPSEFVFAREPKQPPGKVMNLKVIETSYMHLSLMWTKPEDIPGVQDEAKGYFIEVRQAICTEWERCNVTPIIQTSFTAKGLKPMCMYWVRVISTNEGGDGFPQELSNYVLAMPSPVRPRFTNNKIKSFIVVRAGNSVRITINFEASPRPEVFWTKDNVPVTRRVTVSNSDGSSQLLIPSSERTDSGVYSILVKNMVGQEVFSVEVRVTDDPKPPGPIELEENVPGTVTVIWEPSPDEKRDDRLHYIVSKLDSSKGTWTTVADRLFNNKFTVCNIMHGREYHFRVFAKNDMGVSAPSDSPTWGKEKKKEKFVVSLPSRKDCDLRCAPSFIVPLKRHTAPSGYECYMSCAVKGNPTPRITWYRNNISVNNNTNYYISNTCGVCSMLILRVGLKDMGEYSITAENALGRAQCSTTLSVRE